MNSDQFQAIRRWSIIATTAAAVFATGLVYIFLYGPDAQRPDEYAMRQHILSGMSDEALKLIIVNSKREIERKKRLSKEWEEDYWRERNEKNIRCSDEAYKIRHENECKPPLLAIGPPEIRVPSEDEQIGIDLLGRCRYAQSIREARNDGCLPAR